MDTKAKSTNDNGNTVQPNPSSVESPSTHQLSQIVAVASSSKAQDPFLYFSNQERKMAYLTDREEGAQEDHHRHRRPTSTVERKTRISFEVHPSVIFEDLLLEMYDMDDLDNYDQDWLSNELYPLGIEVLNPRQ